MKERSRAPETVVLRMSRYHCFLGDIAGVRPERRVTSREIASELGLTEETVRHDLNYIDVEGRPGAGYDLWELHAALETYLDLSAVHPFIAVGNAELLRGLGVTFPASEFALRLVACYSDRPQDVGKHVGELVIRSLDALDGPESRDGAELALVGCAPESVDQVLLALCASGVKGALMLTPVLRPKHPEGMNVSFFRMPCALKSLAGASRSGSSSCCRS